MAEQLIVTFDRIGRTYNPPALTTPLAHPDRVAEAVYDYARKFLGSRDFEVDLRLPHGDEPGAVAIGWGRMGGGTITPASPKSGETES